MGSDDLTRLWPSSTRASFEWTTAIPHEGDSLSALAAMDAAERAAIVEGLTMIEPVRVSEQHIAGEGWHTFVTLRVWKNDTTVDGATLRDRAAEGPPT